MFRGSLEHAGFTEYAMKKMCFNSNALLVSDANIRCNTDLQLLKS